MKTNSGYVIFMAVVAAIGGILFGYDTAVISGTISSVTGQFSLDTLQQGWYVGCALIGSIIGVLFAGTLSDTIGRKKTMLIAATPASPYSPAIKFKTEAATAPKPFRVKEGIPFLKIDP